MLVSPPMTAVGLCSCVQDPQRTLMDLPGEVLAKLLPYLPDASDYRSLALVSKQIREYLFGHATSIRFDRRVYFGTERPIYDLRDHAFLRNLKNLSSLEALHHRSFCSSMSTMLWCLSFTAAKLTLLRFVGANCSDSGMSLQLSEDPAWWQALGKLLVLDLSGNGLTSLTDPIDKLTNLQELNLCGNNLEHLPSSMGALHQLSKLDLSFNKSKRISAEDLSGCTNIKELDISGCKKLLHLPSAIFQLTALRTLRAVGCEKVTALPEALGNLKQLTKLNMSCCDMLETLPASISLLTNLESLDISNSRVKQLPDGICALRGLRKLHTYGCSELTCLPGNIGDLCSLQELTVDGQEVMLPDSITRLQHLTRLEVGCYREELSDSVEAWMAALEHRPGTVVECPSYSSEEEDEHEEHEEQEEEQEEHDEDEEQEQEEEEDQDQN